MPNFKLTMSKFTWVLFFMVYFCWSQTEAVEKVISTKTQSGDSLLIHLVNAVNKLMTQHAVDQSKLQAQQDKLEKMLKTQEQSIQTQEQSMLSHKKEIEEIKRSLSSDVVGFCVALDRDQSTGGKIAFNRIFSNYGNGWNRITHTFKVPTKGLYFLTLTVMNRGRPPAGAYLRRGSANLQLAFATGGHSSVGTSSVVLMLYPGEHIYAQYWGGIVHSNGNIHTFFTGFLIRKVI